MKIDKIKFFFRKKRKNSPMPNIDSLKLKEPKRNKPSIVIFLLAFILTLILVLASVYYRQYVKLKNNSNATTSGESENVISRVAQVMELPQGENPTVATVSNSNKLKEQDFFKSAENGDKILIYAGYKMAILYRPSVNKIIKVAPLVLDQDNENKKPLDNDRLDYQKDSPLTTQTDEDAVSIKSLESSAADNAAQFDNLNVVINNGTKVVGLTKDIRTKLEEINGMNVLAIGNTKKNNYTKTIVVDLTGNNNEAVNKIVELVGGEVLPLPKEETKPEGADILIIVGK